MLRRRCTPAPSTTGSGVTTCATRREDWVMVRTSFRCRRSRGLPWRELDDAARVVDDDADVVQEIPPEETLRPESQLGVVREHTQGAHAGAAPFQALEAH